MLLIGAGVGTLAALVYILYEFNKPVYVPEIDIEYPTITTDPRLVELLEQALRGQTNAGTA